MWAELEYLSLQYSIVDTSHIHEDLNVLNTTTYRITLSTYT